MLTDKLCGAVNVGRLGWAALVHFARDGDTVVVTAIGRLGRSVGEVTKSLRQHRRDGAHRGQGLAQFG